MALAICLPITIIGFTLLFIGVYLRIMGGKKQSKLKKQLSILFIIVSLFLIIIILNANYGLIKSIFTPDNIIIIEGRENKEHSRGEYIIKNGSASIEFYLKYDDFCDISVRTENDQKIDVFLMKKEIWEQNSGNNINKTKLKSLSLSYAFSVGSFDYNNKLKHGDYSLLFYGADDTFIKWSIAIRFEE